MIELPEEHDLISLFESEPEALDEPKYGWLYNTLTFHLTRETDDLRCIIDPGVERVRLTWTRGEEELADLVLNGVVRIGTEVEGERETLVLTFFDGAAVRDVRMRTRPNVHLYAATDGRIW